MLSGALLAISIVAMIMFGFNFGIDFKGGTITEVSYGANSTSTVAAIRPEQEAVKSEISKLNLGETILQPAGDKGYILRTRELTEIEKDGLISALSLNGKNPATVEKYNSIGPVIGAELKKKAVTAIALVIVCIVLFITFAFRKVSEPVSSWKYGLATVVSLFHDVIIPIGFFIIYIHYRGGEIDILFVSAILSVLGYSVHDTIVVFDRVRENLRINKESDKRESFDITVGRSVSETFGRSINTSLTSSIVLLVLFLVGGETTRNFALVLFIGVIIGTYSSIFVASPLLVTLEKMQGKKK